MLDRMATHTCSASTIYDENDGQWLLSLTTTDERIGRITITFPIEYYMRISNEIDFLNFLKEVLNKQKDEQKKTLLKGIIEELEKDFEQSYRAPEGDTELDSDYFY